jgi:hypothetical protein
MRWSDISAHQRALAAVAHDQLVKPGVLLVGTTRRDGSARISGAEPLIMDGELWLSMMPTSAKARDLNRDPRVLLHSIVTCPAPDAEIMMRGTVRLETGPDVQRRYAAAVAAGSAGNPSQVSSRYLPWTSTMSRTSGMTLGAMLSMWLAGQQVRSTCALP